jgi:peptidoglycan-associated lipoprotein
MKTRILILTAVAILGVAGCHKNQPDQPAVPDTNLGQTAPSEDTNVQNKDLSFDAQGSDSGSIAGLNTVHFAYDKSNIDSEARATIQKNVAWMKSHAGSTLQIEGHCDRHGSIEYNLALGERRAKAVRSYMVNLGASGKHLTTISYGKEKPLDSGETESADAKNRRANFVVQSSK